MLTGAGKTKKPTPADEEKKKLEDEKAATAAAVAAPEKEEVLVEQEDDEEDYTSSSGEEEGATPPPGGGVAPLVKVPGGDTVIRTRHPRHRRRPMTKADFRLEEWIRADGGSVKPLEIQWEHDTHMTFVVPNEFSTSDLIEDHNEQEKQHVQGNDAKAMPVPLMESLDIVILVLFDGDKEEAWLTQVARAIQRLQRKQVILHGHVIRVVAIPHRTHLLNRLRGMLSSIAPSFEAHWDDETQKEHNETFFDIQTFLLRVANEMQVSRHHICCVPFPALAPNWTYQFKASAYIQYYPAPFASLKNWVSEYMAARKKLEDLILQIGCHNQVLARQEPSYPSPDDAKGTNAERVFELEYPFMLSLEQGMPAAEVLVEVQETATKADQEDPSYSEYTKDPALLAALVCYMELFSLIETLLEMRDQRAALVATNTGSVSKTQLDAFEAKFDELTQIFEQFRAGEDLYFDRFMIRQFKATVQRKLDDKIANLNSIVTATETDALPYLHTEATENEELKRMNAEIKMLQQAHQAALTTSLLTLDTELTNESAAQAALLRERETDVNIREAELQESQKAELATSLETTNTTIESLGQQETLELDRLRKDFALQLQVLKAAMEAKVHETNRQFVLQRTEAEQKGSMARQAISTAWTPKLQAVLAERSLVTSQLAELGNSTHTLNSRRLQARSTLTLAQQRELDAVRASHSSKLADFRSGMKEKKELFRGILGIQADELDARHMGFFATRVKGLANQLSHMLHTKEGQAQLVRDVSSEVDAAIRSRGPAITSLSQRIQHLMINVGPGQQGL